MAGIAEVIGYLLAAAQKRLSQISADIYNRNVIISCNLCVTDYAYGNFSVVIVLYHRQVNSEQKDNFNIFVKRKKLTHNTLHIKTGKIGPGYARIVNRKFDKHHIGIMSKNVSFASAHSE